METDPYNKYLKLAVIALLVVTTFYIASVMLTQSKEEALEETAVKLLLDSTTGQTNTIEKDEEQVHEK